MSQITHMLVTCSPMDTAAVDRMNAWCREHADGQIFQRIDMRGAGGKKVFYRAVFACAGNYFPYEKFQEAFTKFGWVMETGVALVVTPEDGEVDMVLV